MFRNSNAPCVRLGKHLLLAAGIAALGLATANAADGGQEKDLEAPEVRVEGEKISESVQQANIDRQLAPNPRTVIDAEQLNQFGDQPLGDALRRLPGVAFPGGNRARDIQLRGIGVEYTQVLINGRRMLDANSKRSVQVDRIPSSMVERVEIIRSPLASVDGQGASGTVNIILKPGERTSAKEFGVGAGYLEDNGGLGDATVLYAGEGESIRYSLLAGVQRQRRNESKDIHTFTGTGAPNAGELGSNERTFDQANFAPMFELDVNPENTLRFEPTYFWTKEDRDDIARELNADQLSIRRTEYEKRYRTRENSGLYSAWKHLLNGDSEVVTSLDYQVATEDTDRDANRYLPDGTLNRSRQRTERIDMEWINPAFVARFGRDGHRFEVGMDASRESRDEDNSEVLNGTPMPPNATRRYSIREDRWNLFGQDTITLAGGNRLTLGLRMENSDTETRDFLGMQTAVSRFFVLPSAHYVHSLARNLDARVSVARTLRRPDLRSLSPSVQTAGGTQANPDIGGNPNTVPESVWGIDLGIERYLWDRRGLLAANIFGRQFDDKIETVVALEAGRFVSRPQNMGDGNMAGLELEARIPLVGLGLENTTIWTNATAVHTRLEDPASGETRRFLDQPDYLFNVGVDQFFPSVRTTFGINANWTSGYSQTYRTTTGTVQNNDVEDAWRVDLSSRTQLTKTISLNVSALNIFAEAEGRVDRSYTGTGAPTATSFTTEPTYRTLYVRLQVSL